MKSAAIALAFGLIFVPTLTPQGLPADVLLLSRVRRHVKEELQRLPNISCLETVERAHKPKNGKMQPLDTVRLEVLTNGTKELYASPGDRKFSDTPPIEWVGSGVLGNGFFGLYLKSVIVDENSSYSWKGDEEIDGRRLARWDYRIPLMFSGQTFELEDGSGRVSLHGSFWADPATGDVVRLTIVAGDIPPTLPLSDAGWSIDYTPTAVGSGMNVLLPDSADFHMTKLSGEASEDRFAFTQCHSFAAESTIRFDEPDTSNEPQRFSAAAIDDIVRTLPPGLRIPIKLKTGISNGAAVGTLIDGVVPSNVALKGKTVIAAGSPVRGRIRRLERYGSPQPYFVVAIEYTEIELQGVRYRFDADLTRLEPVAGVEETLAGAGGVDSLKGTRFSGFGQMVQGRESVSLPELPGVASFFFEGTKLNLPAGFETIWTTRPENERRKVKAAR
jgi:hypothetical protein